MNFVTLYRSSFYVMLVLATLVLNIDATDINRAAMLYPVAVAAACLLAVFTVDRKPELGLSKGTANALAVFSVALVYLEYRYDPDTLLFLSLGHWLVYILLVKIGRPKSARDDRSLFMIALVEVIVGSVMSQSDTVGITLFAWALSSLWVLALSTLSREVERVRPAPGTILVPRSDPGSPYPGLIDSPFLLATARVAMTTLALGGLIFLVMPRQNTAGVATRTDGLGLHLTGFDDEVQLGQLGEILENDNVVMTISLTDRAGESIDPGEELLWRGVGMARYDRGRWRKMATRSSSFPLEAPSLASTPGVIRQQIKLEATDNPILFGLRPILWAEASNRRNSPDFNQADGSIHRPDSRPAALEYVVISTTDPGALQPREQFPGPRTLEELLSIPEPLRATLRPIAESRLVGVDRSDRDLVAARLLEYLRDSGEFAYTLKMDVVDPSIDPVADFLLNRKEGHCEYFASALCLLLRSIDVPCRLVNGFKGGDWNQLARVLSVREKHAHSWCEVLRADRGLTPSSPPSWATLDPTPANERVRSIAQVGGVWSGFRQVTDLVRYGWAFYVVGFNFERQQRFLYEPIRMLIREATIGFRLIGEALRSATSWAFHFPDLSSFISVRGFLVSFGALALLSLLGWLGLLITRRVRRRWRGARPDESTIAVGVLFYRRLVALLEEFGVERSPAETPREYARRAAGFLTGHATGIESVADVPPLVVDAYYRIRFGLADLDAEVLAQLEARLDALESKVRPSSA